MELNSLEWGAIFTIIAVLGAFWGWMVLDCAVEERNGLEKIGWILMILVGNFIGAAIYYFWRRPKRKVEARPLGSQPPK